MNCKASQCSLLLTHALGRMQGARFRRDVAAARAEAEFHVKASASIVSAAIDAAPKARAMLRRSSLGQGHGQGYVQDTFPMLCGHWSVRCALAWPAVLARSSMDNMKAS